MKRYLAAILALLLTSPAFAIEGLGGASICHQMTAPPNQFLTSAGGNTYAATPQLTGDCSGPINNNQVVQLHLNGTVVTGTATYQMLASDVVVAVDATAQNVTVTLPQNLGGQVTADGFIIKTDSSTHTVTVSPFSGDTINGSSSSYILPGIGSALKTFPVNPQQWFAQLDSTSQNQVLPFNTGAATLATGTGSSTYIVLGSGAATTPANQQTPISVGGLVAGLQCYDNVAPGSGQTQTFTFEACTPSSGACTHTATALTCAVTGASGGAALLCSDATHSVTLAAGQYIDMQASCSGAGSCAASELARCTVNFFPF